MKKTFVAIMLALFTISSCGTYTADGAITGGMFGAMIGSAIGGVTGGWRGSNVGQIVGMAGGAVVGATIGRAEEGEKEEKILHRRGQAQRKATRQQVYDYDDSGFDSTNSGDDRIELYLPETSTGQTTPMKSQKPKSQKISPKKNPQPTKNEKNIDDIYFL